MRVLITLDGSPLAERALARLAPWIATWQAEVLLLSILDPRETHETVSASTRQAPPAGLSTSVLTEQLSPHAPAVVIERGRALESVRTEAEDSLRELATRYLPGRAVGVTAEFEEDPAEAIADFVREHEIDFVAMSSHGRTGIGHALLGSVAGGVIHRASVPVIVVGPGEA